jgi:hypothetical protein
MREVLDRMFKEWPESLSLQQVTLEFGLVIFAEMERCEPFCYTKGRFDDDHKRCEFMRAVYRKAWQDYPITMERAKMQYFALHKQ